MPIFKAVHTPGGRPLRAALFGLSARKFWRSNPSTNEMLSTGRALLREDMSDQFSEVSYQAWLWEHDRKVIRKKSGGKTVDFALARMRDDIVNLLDAKTSRKASPGSPTSQAVQPSAPM